MRRRKKRRVNFRIFIIFLGLLFLFISAIFVVRRKFSEKSKASSNSSLRSVLEIDPEHYGESTLEEECSIRGARVEKVNKVAGTEAYCTYGRYSKGEQMGREGDPNNNEYEIVRVAQSRSGSRLFACRSYCDFLDLSLNIEKINSIKPNLGRYTNGKLCMRVGSPVNQGSDRSKILSLKGLVEDFLNKQSDKKKAYAQLAFLTKDLIGEKWKYAAYTCTDECCRSGTPGIPSDKADFAKIDVGGFIYYNPRCFIDSTGAFKPFNDELIKENGCIDAVGKLPTNNNVDKKSSKSSSKSENSKKSGTKRGKTQPIKQVSQKSLFGKANLVKAPNGTNYLGGIWSEEKVRELCTQDKVNKDKCVTLTYKKIYQNGKAINVNGGVFYCGIDGNFYGKKIGENYGPFDSLKECRDKKSILKEYFKINSNSNLAGSK